MTIDAMGRPREIARKINDKGADYVLALKDNQPTLAEDVRLFDAEQSAGKPMRPSSKPRPSTATTGRIEMRKVTVYQNVEWLQERHAWPGLKSVVKVESRREGATPPSARLGAGPGSRSSRSSRSPPPSAR